MPIEENETSKAIKQFSRFAHQYNTYNVIQAEVAKELVQGLVGDKYMTILDIGCGSGEVYKNIEKHTIVFEKFIALDSSQEMLLLHPTDQKVVKIYADFNQLQTYKYMNVSRDDTLLLSSSALQWSKDLDFIFRHLSQTASKAKFAIFTSNTFHTLHKTANLQSPIYSADVLKKTIAKYYDADFEIKEYRLSFESVREMFNYIKKSGVSGGKKQLNYRQIKNLMLRYPLDYLEFEVLYVVAASLA